MVARGSGVKGADGDLTVQGSQLQWGTGSAIQQAIQAAMAAVQGLAGGNLTQAASGAAAPYLAEVIKQTAPDEASRIMAHAAVAGVIAAAQGNSALSGAAGAATTAAMGEAIKNALYGNVPVSQLSEEQKQTLVALGTVAAGLAGGLTGNGTADAVAGAQAGQNEVSNNMMSMGMLELMKAKAVLDSAAMAEAGKGGANEQAALALTKKVKEGLDATCRANPGCVLMAIVSAQSQQHTNEAGSKTETVPVNDDLTGGKLVNPAADETKGTSLVTPDRSPGQGVIHTGNTEGVPDTGGNTTVTPIFEQDKNDYTYLAEGDRPANLSPEGSARAGAFNEAKRQSGIPVSQSPSKVHPNVDKRGNPQPGYIYMNLMYQNQVAVQKRYILEMMLADIFLVRIILKIEDRILTTLKVIIMTTNVFTRCAEDVSSANDIADFHGRYSITGKNISAVSWEITNRTRREGSESLLKLMIKRLLLLDELEGVKLTVIVELSAAQPDSAMVNHKKLWGLLQDRGVNIEGISDKVSFIRKNNDGLKISGAGVIDLSQEGVISSLINAENNVYFAISRYKPKKIDYGEGRSYWMNETWREGGVVFFALGFFDEPSCEIAAMGNKEEILNLIAN